jgi:CubicO group peptidase (beta-lactamase class C family)
MHSGGQIYVSKAGQIILDTAFGRRERDFPMRPDDLMPWLSNTKPLMAIAFGQLLENQRLSLSDPVAKWIPEFAAGGKGAITIEHLLTHTGGFREADKIPENLSWDETIERICAIPLEKDWIPGQTAGYHVSGSWFILGEVLQRVTGARYADYIKQNVFLPLEMRNSFVNFSREEIDRLKHQIAPMFITTGEKSEPHPTLNSPHQMLLQRPGSSGRGPIRELAKLYEMFLADGTYHRERLLEASTVQLLTRAHRIGLYDRTFRHTMDWGLGVIVNSNQYGADTLPYSFGRQASRDSFGHGGAQSSSAFADRQHQLVVAWAFNGMPGEPRHNRRSRDLNTAIYEDLSLASQ